MDPVPTSAVSASSLRSADGRVDQRLSGRCRSCARGGRPPPLDLHAVDDGLPVHAKAIDDVGQSPYPHPAVTVQPRSAGSGRTSLIARVMVERPTPNHQASTPYVTPWRRCTSVARSRSTKTSQLVLRTGTHGPLAWPGCEPDLVASRPQRAYFGDEFSDHTGRQARDTRIVGDRHELVRRCSRSGGWAASGFGGGGPPSGAQVLAVPHHHDGVKTGVQGA